MDIPSSGVGDEAQRELALIRDRLLGDGAIAERSAFLKYPVERACRMGDLDRMRVYDKFVSHVVSPYGLDPLVDYLHRMGTTDAAGFLTEKHVDAFDLIDSELSGLGDDQVIGEDPENQTGERDEIIGVLFSHLDRAEDIAKIIRERHITVASTIRGLLAQMETNHGAVADGTL